MITDDLIFFSLSSTQRFYNKLCRWLVLTASYHFKQLSVKLLALVAESHGVVRV